MIEAKRLCKSFAREGRRGQQVEAVRDVSLTLKGGGFYALVGESGSGKSTLAQLLMGLIPPSAGDVLLDGHSIAAIGRRRSKALCAQVQMVLQDGKSALDPRFSVYDSIAEPLRNLCPCPRSEEEHRVRQLLDQVELGEGLLGRKAAELSGGQQKRVCIARALAPQPRAILFDEAVSGLDVIVRKSILDLLRRLHHEQKATYLMITHDIDVALYLADEIFIMKEGEIVERSRYAGDVSCFTHPYSRLLLQAV